MEGDPTVFDARAGRRGVGGRALWSSDRVVIDRKRPLASKARRSDVHEGSRAHELSFGEARLGRAAESITRDHPAPGKDDERRKADS